MSKLNSAAVSVALIMSVAIVAPAYAVPIQLVQSATYGDLNISGVLRGDLTGDILTLAASPPRSGLVINTNASQSLGAQPTQTFDAGLNVRIHINPRFNPFLSVPAWQFIIGGTADLSAGTANLTVDPVPPALIAEYSGISTPLFSASIVPGLGSIEQALAEAHLITVVGPAVTLANAANPRIKGNITGNWQSVDPGLISVQYSSTGDDVQLNLVLEGMTWNGVYDFDTDVSFPGPILDILGGGIQTQFRSQINSVISSALADLFSNEMDFSGQGFSQNCTGLKRAQTVTCQVSGEFAYAGRLTQNVAEPASMALFGLGLAGLVFAARRRPHNK